MLPPGFLAGLDSLVAQASTLQPLTPSASPNTAHEHAAACRSALTKIMAITPYLEDATAPAEGGGEEPDSDQAAAVEQRKAEERYKNILAKFDLDSDCIVNYSPIYFKNFLLKAPRGKRTDLEDDALLMLLVGRFVGRDEEWSTALAPLIPSQRNWESICVDSTVNDDQDDLVERLLYTHRVLAVDARLHSAAAFVDYVLRTVQVLKFTIAWISDVDQPGSKKRKSDYITAAFKYNNPDLYQQLEITPAQSAYGKSLKSKLNQKLRTFRKEHTKVIAARKTLLSLYKACGPAIFFNCIWDTIDVHAPHKMAKRSALFKVTVNHMCKNIPQTTLGDNNTPVYSVPMYHYQQNSLALFNILKLLASPAVAHYVIDFIDLNPPALPEGMTSDEIGWGVAA